jgi:CRP-like cAMP-binding protein
LDQSTKRARFELSRRNRLLASLPDEDWEALRPGLEPVELKSRQILHHSKMPMPYVYFIEKGLVSVLARTTRDQWVEVWLSGVEGMTGIPVVLGDEIEPPLRRIVQVGGRAFRMPSADFRRAVEGSRSLRHAMLKYVQVVMLQTSQSGACNSHHSLKQRLARWLLLARDALEEDALPLTHNVLARLLGVRRPSVTDCLGVLEEMGALRNTRSLVTITDPAELETVCCDCHRLIRREYDRLLGPRPRAQAEG